jgi:hypothetical protein
MPNTIWAFPSDSGGDDTERDVFATARPSIVTRLGQWSQLTMPVSLLMPSEVQAAASGPRR